MMEMCIKLQDLDGVVHREFRFKFGMQDTLDHLNGVIESTWNIDQKYQELFSEDGRKLIGFGEDSLQSLGLKHRSKVIVKHARLGTWSEYLAYCKLFNDTKNAKPERTKFAHQAITCSKALEDSGFLIVYAPFGPQWRDTISPMMRFVDRTQGFRFRFVDRTLKQSATTFFSQKYPNAKIDFKSKQGGSRAGIVVIVTCNGEETTYYMKTYHHAGSSMSLQNTSKRHLPDLREMFVYRLLELIGVGPVVYFPFYDGLTCIHYIATEEVEEFKELDKLEDIVLQKKVVVEAYLLSLILGIRDLNEGNIGSTKGKSLSIIDFYVPDADNFSQHRIVDDLKNKSNFGGLGIANEILTEIGHEDRMKIAMDALPHWSRISSMTSDIIGTEKSELRKHGIKFGTATNDVENYIQDIKLNYDSICSAFK